MPCFGDPVIAGKADYKTGIQLLHGDTLFVFLVLVMLQLRNASAAISGEQVDNRNH